jgi:hypothetical protein
MTTAINADILIMMICSRACVRASHMPRARLRLARDWREALGGLPGALRIPGLPDVEPLCLARKPDPSRRPASTYLLTRPKGNPETTGKWNVDFYVLLGGVRTAWGQHVHPVDEILIRQLPDI